MPLKKIQPGSKVTRFPAGTFNQLVAGEIRDRQKTPPQAPAIATGTKSPFIVRIKWNGDETILPGAVVVLGEVLVTPADRPSAPYEGLQFNADEYADGDASKHTAIMLGPVEPDGVGYGHMAPAVWAKVFVSDENHKFAKPRAGESVMGSGSSGRPIIWKEDGVSPEEPEEGEDPNKWAVVSLGTGSRGGFNTGLGAVDLQACLIIGRIEGTSDTITVTDGLVSAATHVVGLADPDPTAKFVLPMQIDDSAFVDNVPTEPYNFVHEVWPADHADAGKIVAVEGWNHAQDFPIVAGDGKEIFEEATPTGRYNPRPLWGLGYKTARRESNPEYDPEDEESEEYLEIPAFVILLIENPTVIYEALLAKAMADDAATGEFTSEADIWGRRPEGKRDAENLHKWFANVGAKAQILRGYDRDTIINIEGVCEEDFVPPPPEE